MRKQYVNRLGVASSGADLGGEYFHFKATTGGEKQHRAKLWIETAPKDKFVSIVRNYRLDSRPQEMLGADLLAHA